VVHPDTRSVQNRFARVIAFGELQHADHVIALVDCASEVQIVHYATMRSGHDHTSRHQHILNRGQRLSRCDKLTQTDKLSQQS
jgi:hypothetical protein